MTVITMSRNELMRLRVLIDVGEGRISVEDATGLIGVGRRQIYRLLDAFRVHGADGLISRKRGRPSNRARGAVFRETVLAIVRERYADFGPTPVQVRGRLVGDCCQALARLMCCRPAVGGTEAVWMIQGSSSSGRDAQHTCIR